MSSDMYQYEEKCSLWRFCMEVYVKADALWTHKTS